MTVRRMGCEIIVSVGYWVLMREVWDLTTGQLLSLCGSVVYVRWFLGSRIVVIKAL